MQHNHLEYRKALGNFVTGVAIIVSKDNYTQKPFAITINSFSSVSLEPKIISWCLGLHNKYQNNFLSNNINYYNIQILPYIHQNLAIQFSKTQFSQDFDSDFFNISDNNLPILKSCIAYFECEYYNNYLVGDHQLFLGKVLNFYNFNENTSMDTLSFVHGKMGKI